jgi:hypothetical protein
LPVLLNNNLLARCAIFRTYSQLLFDL